MKWLAINSNLHHEIYELWTTKDKLLTVNYHREKGTLRITSNNEKRVFLIGKEGFLRTRTVLRNEYGIRMGQLYHESIEDNQGRIEIYDEEFNYLVQNNFPRRTAIYKDAEMLVVCELPPDSQSNNLLILLLCWYISAEVEKQPNSYPVEAYA